MGAMAVGSMVRLGHCALNPWLIGLFTRRANACGGDVFLHSAPVWLALLPRIQEVHRGYLSPGRNQPGFLIRDHLRGHGDCLFRRSLGRLVGISTVHFAAKKFVPKAVGGVTRHPGLLWMFAWLSLLVAGHLGGLVLQEVQRIDMNRSALRRKRLSNPRCSLKPLPRPLFHR